MASRDSSSMMTKSEVDPGTGGVRLDPNQSRLFVVSAIEDEGFVDGFLLKELALPKEEVMVSTRPGIGQIILEELERGALSKLTVVVLSPAFRASAWAQFAGKLAMHQSVEATSKVVPLVLRDCEQDLLTRFRVGLDFSNSDKEHWKREVEKLRGMLRAPDAVEEVVRCPYPGMRAFEEKDAADFYGRRQEVREALGHLRSGVRALYVIGPSGSGKSSLVAAGLLPEIQRAPALAGGRYVVRTMRPGAEPVAALVAALEVAAMAVSPHGESARGPQEREPLAGGIEIQCEHAELKNSEGQRQDAAGRWKTAVDQLMARNVGHDRVLLVVDQLEELFTTAKGVTRRGFEDALRELRSEERVVLVLTMRADFYGALMESALWDDMGGCPTRLEVTPLRAARLREAIEAPARSLGVYYEQVLVEQLLKEVEDEVGALPLLQDTLLELWHERSRGLVRLADYEGISQFQ